MGKIIKNGVEYSYSPLPNAAGVTYNNLNSGLSATTVQGAIDEVSIDLFKIVNFDAPSVSVNAGATRYFSASDYNYQKPTGYDLLATLSVRTNNDNFYIRYFHPESYVVVRNTASSAQSVNVSITVVFVKTGHIAT